MKSKTIAALDTVSGALLLLWLCLAVVHFFFRHFFTALQIDVAAWTVFGASAILSGLVRWLNEVTDIGVIGPFKLWVAACSAALLFCMVSSFVATPRLKALQTQLAAQGITARQRESLSSDYAKVHNFSMQFLLIRAALAAGLVLGLRKLPRRGASSAYTKPQNE